MKKLGKFIVVFFKKITSGIAYVFKTIITRTFLALGFFFTWVVPIYLLNDQIALTKEVSTTWKFTFVGLIVLVTLCLIYYKKIKEKVNNYKPKNGWQLAFQFLLMTVYRLISLGGIYFLMYYLISFMEKILQWWYYSLFSIGVGLLFYFIDRIIMFVKGKKQITLEKEQFKNEIKAEIING